MLKFRVKGIGEYNELTGSSLMSYAQAVDLIKFVKGIPYYLTHQFIIEPYNEQ
jgi:hypothetical protein